MTTSKDTRLGEFAVWGVLVALHLSALFTFMPPHEIFAPQPILGADHPAHAHRVHVYRAALHAGTLPWGYDPAVSAGVVMRPTQDAGAKPQELLGAIAGFLTDGQVIRIFLFVSAALFPIWSLLAARGLSYPAAAMPWVALFVAGPTWLYTNFFGYFAWGLAAFAFASFVGPLALVSVLRFLEGPSWSRYAWACGIVSSQLFLHVLAPLLLIPAIPLAIPKIRSLEWKWIAALACAPLIVCVVNAWWFIPFVLDFLLTPSQTDRLATTYPADLMYVSWEQLASALTWERLAMAMVALCIAAYGVTQMTRISGRLATASFAFAGLLGVALKFFGSFIPVVVEMQPSRFLLSGFVYLAFPIALAAYALCAKLRLQNGIGVVGFAIGLVVLSACSDQFDRQSGYEYQDFAGNKTVESAKTIGLPQPVFAPPIFDSLTEFVRTRIAPGERLLVQTRVQCAPKIAAQMWQREVLGNSYPDQSDPVNFLADRVFARAFAEWKPVEFREALARWGIAWIVAWNEPATKLAAAASDSEGEQVGLYRIFHVSQDPGRFLVGGGEVRAGVNVLELKNLHPENGLVVLRYRYHPAWTSPDGTEIEAYPVPEDSAGFIALRNPSANVTLRFAPLRLFFAPWR